MIRKTLIGITAAIGVVIGMTALVGEASARHRSHHSGVNIVLQIGGGGHHVRHRHGHCHVYRVRDRFGHRRLVRECHRHGHRAGHH